MTGFIVNTKKAYEEKQAELALELKLGNDLETGKPCRYAGRKIGSKIIPDITLKTGGYFIPHSKGPDQIDPKKEILVS